LANCHVWRFSPPACQWQPSFVGLAVQCWRALEAMGEVYTTEGTRDETHGRVQLHIDLTCVSRPWLVTDDTTNWLCSAMRSVDYAVARCLFVRLSICHTPVLCRNGQTDPQTSSPSGSHTTYSSFYTPNVMAIFRRDPLTRAGVE